MCMHREHADWRPINRNIVYYCDPSIHINHNGLCETLYLSISALTLENQLVSILFTFLPFC